MSTTLTDRDKIVVIKHNGNEAVIWTNDYTKEELELLIRTSYVREATILEKEFWYLHSSPDYTVVYLTYFKDWLKERK